MGVTGPCRLVSPARWSGSIWGFEGGLAEFPKRGVPTSGDSVMGEEREQCG